MARENIFKTNSDVILGFGVELEMGIEPNVDGLEMLTSFFEFDDSSLRADRFLGEAKNHLTTGQQEHRQARIHGEIERPWRQNEPMPNGKLHRVIKACRGREEGLR
jgi:hypothetical protein